MSPAPHPRLSPYVFRWWVEAVSGNMEKRVGRHRWRGFFRFKGCCGGLWGSRTRASPVMGDDEEHIAATPPPPVEPEHDVAVERGEVTSYTNLGCLLGLSLTGSRREGMSLAAALEVERQFRAGAAEDGVDARASKMSLMRLLAEGEVEVEVEDMDVGGACCVCMGRRKGAAFIPCGHTFCRVCAREVWLNRGSCPLCNSNILEILDIF